MLGRNLCREYDVQRGPVSNSVGGGAAIVLRIAHLSAGIKRSLTRSLEMLLNLERDPVSPGLEWAPGGGPSAYRPRSQQRFRFRPTSLRMRRP